MVKVTIRPLRARMLVVQPAACWTRADTWLCENQKEQKLYEVVNATYTLKSRPSLYSIGGDSDEEKTHNRETAIHGNCR